MAPCLKGDAGGAPCVEDDDDDDSSSCSDPPLVVIAVQAPGPAARSPFCSFLKVDSLVPLSVLVDPVIHNLTFRFT